MDGQVTQSRTIVLLSGGLDSTAVLAMLSDHRPRLEALFVDYGQPAAPAERVASRSVASKFGVSWQEVSALPGPVAAQGEVPGRNLLLLALANTWAQSSGGGALRLALGIHAGTSYADCSPAFVRAAQALLDLGTGGSVRVVAPFLFWSKSTLAAWAMEKGVPIHLTFSCERGPKVPCGTCLSCRDRAAVEVVA